MLRSVTGPHGASRHDTRGSGRNTRYPDVASRPTRGAEYVYNSYMLTGESGLPAGVLLPAPGRSVVAIEPPHRGAGYWAGAPSAALGDDGIYLAYRMRRPVGHGRGYALAIA